MRVVLAVSAVCGAVWLVGVVLRWLAGLDDDCWDEQ